MNVDKAKRNISRVLGQIQAEMCHNSSSPDVKIAKWAEILDDALTFLGD